MPNTIKFYEFYEKWGAGEQVMESILAQFSGYTRTKSSTAFSTIVAILSISSVMFMSKDLPFGVNPSGKNCKILKLEF